MILTCPQCASRYEVADGSVPPQGRTVRCAGCSASWRAEPVGAEHPPLDLRSEPALEAPPEQAKPAASGLPKSIRAKNEARRRTREAAVAGAVWGVLGALLLGVIGGAALFRVEVVRLWPRAAGAYATVGLPVNPTGLAPENIQAGPGLKNGHAAVLVSGVVRNVERRPHDPVPLRIALLDKNGKPLAHQLVNLPHGRLAPGQTRPFAAAFLDPPSASAGVQIEFALDLAEKVPPKPGVHAPKGHGEPERHVARGGDHLRGAVEPSHVAGPAPKEAVALPASDPHALPAAAEANTHRPHEG
jgi:predicted Zn finger-like uncharacterized protein